MPTGFYSWSETAASNGSSDSVINFLEGQSPSSLNDSCRSLMAVLRKWGTDISGAIETAGSSTAYTVTSHSVFDTLANMDGEVIAFTPHTTNGATVTLNCDGLGAKPLRSAPSTELVAGVLVEGTPYAAVYNNSDSAFYLHGFFNNPYTVPIGVCLDFYGTTAPNSSFVLPYGQAISRTTYSTLFSMFSTTYGSGDGSTTFNIPDLRGRVSAGKDDMGGSSANRLTNADDGLNGDTLGATGGGETQTLVTGNLPAYTPAGSISVTTDDGSSPRFLRSGAVVVTGGSAGSAFDGVQAGTGTLRTVSASFTGTAQGGTSTAFGVIQPTIICNKLLRII